MSPGRRRPAATGRRRGAGMPLAGLRKTSKLSSCWYIAIFLPQRDKMRAVSGPIEWRTGRGAILVKMRATTILAVRHNGAAAIGGDGQVTLGQVVMKSDARKIRRLRGGKVVVGFAGASADAFALLERFEAKLKDFQGSVPRAATELAKDWRTDRALRRLEAMMIAVDRDSLLMLSGTGDVIQPSEGAAAIGSGGSYALAAARALVAHSNLNAAEIVKTALDITGDLCIYTNKSIEVEVIE